jgi:predicted  nucleic acid-binding Zn-ribbon protein
MPHTNEEVIKMVRAKLELKNKTIGERNKTIKELQESIKKIEEKLAEANRQLENREGLIDAIGDILNEDGTP